MHTLIIAEAGVNHNGSMETAKRLIDAAAIAGVDYVKFQSFKADKLVSKSAKKADYQKLNLNDTNDSQFEMLKKLELSEEDHLELIDYCNKNGIKFLSTGFDTESIDFLDNIKTPFFKIPSGEITNKPFLQHIAQKGKPVILSTGMANMNEIGEALEVILSEGIRKENITILHCNTEYPTPMADVNLKAMLHIQKEFGTLIGYSDHTLGIEIPIAAVALGASVIEKHFTLNRGLPGPDHRASLEPDELKAMVQAIRNIEMAISGSGRKEPSESEKKNIGIARKSIVAATKINIGDFFTNENLTAKRPGTGISPMRWDDVLGSKAKRTFNIDELIEL